MSIYFGNTILTGAGAASGGGSGGGLLNVRKYSSFRAIGGATIIQLFPDFTASHVGAQAASNTANEAFATVNNFPSGFAPVANALVGIVFEQAGGNLTITTNSVIDGIGRMGMTLNRQDGSVGGFYNTLAHGDTMQFRSANTVNPASDLGIEDGGLLGYFMVGGGASGPNVDEGGDGGRILQGTIIVPTASTDLTLTVGDGGSGGSTAGTASTITGGLTLTTADGSSSVGWAGAGNGSNFGLAAGQGINGYGAGGAGVGEFGGTIADNNHGFGGGSRRTGTGGDGAIILIY